MFSKSLKPLSIFWSFRGISPKPNNSFSFLPVVACPYIATPRNGTKNYQTEQENNLVGAHIIFECDEGTTLTGPEERICQENGEWTGEGDNDCVGELQWFLSCIIH